MIGNIKSCAKVNKKDSLEAINSEHRLSKRLRKIFNLSKASLLKDHNKAKEYCINLDYNNLDNQVYYNKSIHT